MFWITLSLSAFGGDHKPLCDKVQESDLVFEIAFVQKGSYPEKQRTKEWAPPPEELSKTAHTGVVARVFKGSLESGSPFNKEWGVHFNPGGNTVEAWDKFFALDAFKQIYFLRAEDGRFTRTGWAEESADCGPESNHRSWCSGYDDFQSKILSCLSK